MTQFISVIATPLKDAARVAQREETKRLHIWSDLFKYAINRVVWVVVALIGLAGLAIWRDHPELAVNLVIAVVGFSGGFGLGKGTAPRVS